VLSEVCEEGQGGREEVMRALREVLGDAAFGTLTRCESRALCVWFRACLLMAGCCRCSAVRGRGDTL
jgi:hypothetical protein